MLPKTITTAELRSLTGYSKAGIVELEQSGVIKRDAVDKWPIEMVTKVVARLRERKPAVSDERARWETARALREERKAALEARELCLMSDFETTQQTMTALVFAALDAVGARLHPHDRAARLRLTEEHTIMKAQVAGAFGKLADDLTADPVSLMPTNIPEIRQRLFGRPNPLPPLP